MYTFPYIPYIFIPMPWNVRVTNVVSCYIRGLSSRKRGVGAIEIRPPYYRITRKKTDRRLPQPEARLAKRIKQSVNELPPRHPPSGLIHPKSSEFAFPFAFSIARRRGNGWKIWSRCIGGDGITRRYATSALQIANYHGLIAVSNAIRTCAAYTCSMIGTIIAVYSRRRKLTTRSNERCFPYQ